MNNWFIVILVFNLSLSVYSEEIEDVLELDQSAGFLGKLSSDRSQSGHRSFNSDPDFNRNTDGQEKLNLKQFLETYAKKHNKKPHGEQEGENLDQLSEENVRKTSKDKSINQWTLLDVQKNNHPFDERKGWVSLEPIPWSVSKISKWQSKYKPSSERPWDEHGPISSQRPAYEDDLELFSRPISITPPNPYVYHRPTESLDRYDRLKPTSSSPYPKPTAFFGNKIHVETHFPSNSFSSTAKPYVYHNQKDCNHPNHPYEGIITDGQPSNFPTQSNPYDSFRRRGTEMEIHADGSTHPFNGEGEWVLLSTTKGYKPQRNRQRSLQIDSTSEPGSQILRASRGVRLTVLPPLKGSNINMTTSHGGLLQVESTFESVEQAKQKFDKKQNSKTKIKRKRKKSNKNTAKQELTSQYNDPEAVMAAVGAGMIPATMAMMVPIAMTG